MRDALVFGQIGLQNQKLNADTIFKMAHDFSLTVAKRYNAAQWWSQIGGDCCAGQRQVKNFAGMIRTVIKDQDRFGTRRCMAGMTSLFGLLTDIFTEPIDFGGQFIFLMHSLYQLQGKIIPLNTDDIAFKPSHIVYISNNMIVGADRDIITGQSEVGIIGRNTP